MAKIKGWRRNHLHRDAWTNASIGKEVIVGQIFGKEFDGKWVAVVRYLESGRVQSSMEFNTKAEALEEAMSYMKRNS